MDISTDLARTRAQLEHTARQLETRTRQLADRESVHLDELWRAHKVWMVIALAVGVLGVIVGHLA